MKLESGRKYLWQWDRDQRLEVPEGCTQVHFANGTSDLAQYENVFVENDRRLVKVPCNMLKVAATLRCYAWDGASVFAQASFEVLPREKPDLYVEPEEVRRFDKLEQQLAEQVIQTDLRGQGRSAKYNFTTPGWKRVLNIIRGSGGMLNFCFGQSAPLYMAQTAGIVFSGFVKYGNDKSADAKPVIYQMYNNIFGEDDALEKPGSITKVRIGYPDPNQDNYDNGTVNAIRNPINCYLDVYVDFDKDALNSGDVGFQMNYAGFADSHRCVAIDSEQDAEDTGIYGEKLLYYELELKEGADLYIPDGIAEAKRIEAAQLYKKDEEVWSAKETADRYCPAFVVDGGTMVAVDPIEGYPLQVITDLNGAVYNSGDTHTVVHCGKNLLGSEASHISNEAGAVYKHKNGAVFTRLENGGIHIGGETTGKGTVIIGTVTLPPGLYTYSIGFSDRDDVYGQLHEVPETGSEIQITTYVGKTKISHTFELTKTTKVRARLIFVPGAVIDVTACPQIEIGQVISPLYEKHHKVEHTVELIGAECYTVAWDKGECEYANGGTGEGRAIMHFTPHKFAAWPGINVLYTIDKNASLFSIIGRCDPLKQIEALKDAIIAIGGRI